MSDERIDSIVNRPAIQSDLEFIMGGLNRVVEAIKTINATSINVGNSKGMSDAAKATEQSAKAADELAAAQAKAKATNDALSQGIAATTGQWRDMQGTMQQNIKLQIQYESELRKVKAQIKQLADATNGNVGATKAAENNMAKLRLRANELKIAISDIGQTLKAQTKETRAAETSMDAMNQELGQMRNLYRSLTATMRNEPMGRELLVNIDKLDAELKRLDATMGNHQRNVGNYKSGFNGLGNSINQITRELPAFTFSAQTGFLALSNNIPILADNIAQTSRQIKAMRAEGQKVPGLFKQIAAGIFSFGTALSLGVTLITIFGKQIGEAFEKLFAGKRKVDAAKESIEGLNKALESSEYKDVIQKFSELEVAIDAAKKGVISKKEAVDKMNESLNLAEGAVTNLDQAEQYLIDNKDKYIEMIQQKALANAFFAKAAEEAIKAQGAELKDNTSFIDKAILAMNVFFRNTDNGVKHLANTQKQATDDVKKSSQEFADLLTKNGKAAYEAYLKLQAALKIDTDKGSGRTKKDKAVKVIDDAENIRKSIFEIQKRMLEDNRDSNDAIVKNDEEAFLQRTAAAKKYLAGVLAIRKLEYDFDSNEITEAENKKQITQAGAIAKRKELEVKYNSDVLKINAQYQGQYLDQLKKFLDKEQDEREKAKDRERQMEADELKNNWGQSMLVLDQKRAAGLISEQEYNKKKLQYQTLYQIESLKKLIEFAKQQVEIAEQVAAATGDPAAIERVRSAKIKLAALEIDLAKTVAKYRIEAASKEDKEYNALLDARLAKLKQYSDTAIEVLGIIGGFLNAQNEKEKNQIQEQIELLQKKRDAEIEAVNASVLSEQDKAAKIAIINARAQSQKEQLELRQRQLDQRKARFDKALVIASIIQETALAVIKALSSKPPNIILAAAVGAIGAAKLAVAAATPIPTYAEGTDDHKGGLAIVGDGGRRELVSIPSGKHFVTPDTATLVNLPKGSKVLPDADAAMEGLKYAAFKQMPAFKINENNYAKEMTAAIVGEMGKLNTTVKNKKETQLLITFAGQTQVQKKAYNFSSWLNSAMKSGR